MYSWETHRTYSKFKWLRETTLNENFETGLHTLMLHLHDPATDNEEGFDRLESLDALQVERCNVHIERAHRTTSQCVSLGIMETVAVMDTRTQVALRRADGMHIGEVSMEAE